MDRINSNIPNTAGFSSISSTSDKIKSKKIKDKKPPTMEKPQLDIPMDQFDATPTTRPERMKIFFDKMGMNMAEYTQMGTSALVGEMVGSAIAFATIGGIVAPAVGGAVGAGLGIIGHKYGLDKKVFTGVQTAMAYTLKPFIWAGRQVKNAVKATLNLIKPSKEKKEDKESSLILPENKLITPEKDMIIVGDQKTSKLSIPNNKLILPDQSLITGQEGIIVPDKQGNWPSTQDAKEVLSKIGDGIGTGAKIARAVPKFIYPSIQNATAVETKMIMETLDALPLKTVTSTNTIIVNPNLKDTMQASGLARNLLFDNPIDLDRYHAALPGFNKEVLIHELGHTLDFSKSPIPGTGISNLPPYGKGPYLFDSHMDVVGEAPYSATNHFEDYAQTHQMYHTRPEELQKQTPEKFAAMQKQHEPTLYDKVMDRTGIRDLGKKLAVMIDKVPGLRTALNVAGKILGPITLNLGTEKIEAGIREGDPMKRYQGKMESAQGIAFTSKIAAPVGLGILLSQIIVNKKIEKGKMTPEEAEEFSNKALAVMAGPVGLTYLAAVHELTRTPQGEKLGEFQYIDEKGKRLLDKIKEGFGWQLFDVKEKETGRTLPPIEENLRKDDKIFMTKVGTGAAVGGIGGTVGGFISGGMAGAALGGLVGGPFGMALGGFLGKVIGTLAGSYTGAKLGAKGGRLLDKESRQVKMKMMSQKVKSSFKSLKGSLLPSSVKGKETEKP